MTVDPAVEVVAVSRAEPAGPVTACELESPVTGGAASGYAFLLRGRLRTRAGGPGVRRIAVSGAGRLARGSARELSPAEWGFSMAVGCVAQPREFELDVVAVLDDGTRAELARIRGRRAPLESGFAPTIQPLIVTTLGRSGSSLLVGMLGAHPAIVAYRPFGREPRAASYWVDVFRELADPVSAARQLARGELPNIDERGWWLGKGVPQEYFTDDGMLDWLGLDHVRSLAGFCQGRLESLYATVAAKQGTAAPRYLAEKMRPDGIAATLRELYPNSREVILVRDCRDMFCSMRSFNAGRGAEGFGRDTAAGDEQHLAVLRRHVEHLLSRWAAAPDQCRLLRYEDLVLDPARTIAGVLDYLELERPAAVIDGMLAVATHGDPAQTAHRTTASAEQSIGRWRRELDGPLKERCAQELGPALARLGYETD